ncbi:LysR substrate-binding domain-containing protein [Pseudodonghicola xiamenensis]|uniref:LysR substrate-binding domain-containing protein n=1 Tax=Pseudodonghicola xiamenensis TaxID=337702 RepID=A0A8J3H7P9_9RHOB|nr:LysR substrate-binding domain-containing protein [Pseudodonghicola xiamenensis]GHG97300.1 hypothetical protein GCM10010961_32080 [Pseudodonghicola xiamenensis]
MPQTDDRTEAVELLRIAAPLDYGQSFLVPVLAQFRALYPACTVALDLRDSLVDLQAGDWDLAIRLGWLSNSSLKSRRVGSIMQHLVAAPSLAAQFAPPTHPEALGPWPFVTNSALREPPGTSSQARTGAGYASGQESWPA